MTCIEAADLRWLGAVLLRPHEMCASAGMLKSNAILAI